MDPNTCKDGEVHDRNMLVTDAEKLVREHMSRYDPSHDWFHGALVSGHVKAPVEVKVTSFSYMWYELDAIRQHDLIRKPLPHSSIRVTRPQHFERKLTLI